MRTDVKGALIATAVAGLFLTHATVVRAEEGAAAKVHCSGVNACKGQGACNGVGHDCAGKNECKGKGWVEMSEADCKAKGGTVAK